MCFDSEAFQASDHWEIVDARRETLDSCSWHLPIVELVASLISCWLMKREALAKSQLVKLHVVREPYILQSTVAPNSTFFPFYFYSF